jgi:hypothetical protein
MIIIILINVIITIGTNNCILNIILQWKENGLCLTSEYLVISYTCLPIFSHV